MSHNKKSTEDTHPKDASKSADNREFSAFRYIWSAFRKFPITDARPLAYASEVGESFRPVISPWFVKGLYGVSILYVAADTTICTNNVYKAISKNIEISDDEKNKIVAINFTDKAIWHTFASMVLPAVTIHSIVKYSGYGYKKLPRLTRYSPICAVITGLISIPFIIHPLDHLTDYGMDNSIRRMYSPCLVRPETK